MTFRFATALALCGLLGWVVPLGAHHALQAQFDVNKTVELKGTLERVEWVNPHAYLYLDVKDEKTGAVKRWGWETIGPQALRRAGFTRGPASFTVGETYTFVGFAALDGTDKAFTTAVLFPDGRKITLWFGDPFSK